MDKIKKLIILILVLLTVYQPLTFVLSNQARFFDRTYDQRYESLKKLYYSSQYAVKKNPVIITDDALEAFAGGAFLKGLNPILIVHDHPPLGRYITSLSILFFDNENTITIINMAGVLIGLYLISRKATGDNLFALIPIAIFANEPLLLSKLNFTPSLELLQMPYVVYGLYTFIKMSEAKKFFGWATLTAFLLGCVVSTRFFIVGGAMFTSMILFLVIVKKQRRKILGFILALPVIPIVLLLSYTRTIMDNNSIIKTLGIQKYILNYHNTKFTNPFTMWDLLLFNKWHTWWGARAIIKDPNWSVLWPISFTIDLVIVLYSLFRKIPLNNTQIVIALWCVCYMGVLSVGYSSTRYFILLIPFLYILMSSLIANKKIRSYFLK